MGADFLKTENMLANLERIWLDSKGNELYQLIEAKDEYKIEKDNGYFEMLFMDAVIDFDYGIKKFNLWGCDPTPEAILAGFIFDVVKAIAECYKGSDVRKKIYKLFLYNYMDFYFSPLGLREVDKVIAKNNYLKVPDEENDKYDYSLPLEEFVKKYTEIDLPEPDF